MLYVGIQNTPVHEKQKAEYLPRGRNTLHEVFEHHFTDFCSRYNGEYADTFGKFRLERIQAVGEQFLTCGDYRQGIARIRCSNPECGHDYFRPFSCKGFYLCPRMHECRCVPVGTHLMRATSEVSDQPQVRFGDECDSDNSGTEGN